MAYPAEKPDELSPKEAIEVHNQTLDNYLRDIDFESMTPEEILTWATTALNRERIVLSTSFQYSGVAMIHMVNELDLDMRIATVDTLRLHPETLEFIGVLEARYGREIEIHTPDPEQIASMVERFGEYLFFDNKAKQEYCCRVRKTLPHDELLKTADCWISGLRRDQSTLRGETPKAVAVPENGTRRRLLKLNPLADWSLERLLASTEEKEIPKHPLYARGYPGFGCTICSTPTLPGEDQRAGRWRWFNEDDHLREEDMKECGLHIPMYNI